MEKVPGTIDLPGSASTARGIPPRSQLVHARHALHPSEHCFIVRVPGAKGCPGCETLPLLPPRQNFSVSFSQLVAGWRERPLLRASNEHFYLFTPHSPSQRGGLVNLYCAPASSTFLACAMGEQGDDQATSHLPYCHPLTSYPFSIKHRTTASAYGGSGSSGL